MSTIATAQFGSDDEDADFAPALKDLHDAASNSDDSDDSQFSQKPRKKKRKLQVAVDDTPKEPECARFRRDVLQAERLSRITKESIDELWASFNDAEAPAAVAKTEDSKPTKLVTIKKQFKFAGDVIEFVRAQLSPAEGSCRCRQDVQVLEDSEEAIAFLEAQKEAPSSLPAAPTPDSTAEPPQASTSKVALPPKKPPPMRKKGGLAAMQAKLATGAKPKKLTTLEKSKYDWDACVIALP
jgi:hypothetical protein